MAKSKLYPGVFMVNNESLKCEKCRKNAAQSHIRERNRGYVSVYFVLLIYPKKRDNTLNVIGVWIRIEGKNT